MRCARRIAAASLALALCAGCATVAGNPDDSVDTAPVLAADQARIRAFVDADRFALEKVLDPSLTYTHSNGAQDTKQSLIESLVHADVDYRSIEPSDVVVRRRGTTAVLTCTAKMRVAVGDAIHDVDADVTAVYFLTDQGWQLAAYQSTKRPE